MAVVGLAGGLFAGVFGVGGGFIMVPLLQSWARLDQARAHATSLLAITPVAVIGAVSYAIGGVFAWLPAIFVALGGVVGAQLGAWILRRTNVAALRWGFIAFIVASGGTLVIALPNRESSIDVTVTTALVLAVIGLAMGVSTGLLGVGGGILVIPLLVITLDQSDLVAKSISLLAMAPGSVSGSFAHLKYHTASLRDGAWVAAGAIITTPLGTLVAFALPPRAAALLYGVLMFLIAMNLIVRAIRDRTRS